MSESETDPEVAYTVVCNHEEQYSIWFANREIPAGWRPAGPTGPKAECLAYIEKVWTDMRPLSVRRHFEEQQAHAPSVESDSPS